MGILSFYHPVAVFAQERIFANNLDANCKNVGNPAGLNLLQLILIASSQKNSYHCPASFCLNNNHGTDLAFLMLAGACWLLMEV